MPFAALGDILTHYREDGPEDGPVLAFANALGTELSIWDDVVARLPDGLRVIRYDMRGHGQTSVPPGPYYMGDLVQDAGRLFDHLGAREVVMVGLSIGGMVAQGLAAERLDLIRAMVLSNTASKIGTSEIWQDRIAQVRDGGIEAVADATMERWFPRATRRTHPGLVARARAMLVAQDPEGFMACAAAIGETDLYESTARLTLPTLGIAGSEDGSTPTDLVRETTSLIKGAKFEIIRRAGHVPCIDQPETYAAVLTAFLTEIGHI
ncbi:3-oxoadipate enol-lactonase [Maritimibacter sp. DP1N21-5]|uniref:3-oxoadipate enol-lactonase n=1 Tax=Maritimibacter sp. DP1N21-5 TaxID=2836867 RepID=UPI001C47ED44|nr:3-oxoadipate enol-lactonase [Maritimibacter sp. DP1N21-5]MBV7408610.1 3-oxoadipate enol-lactonase [Maritimibacter sp. DP1N21-5]